jgi:CubicO group peptidase (beta-lactamase class C family)
VSSWLIARDRVVLLGQLRLTFLPWPYYARVIFWKAKQIMMRLITSYFIILFLFPAPVYADPLGDAVKAEMTRQGIPGLSLAIVEDGKVTRLNGYGKATLEHDVAVTADTVFQAGSIAKQFTSTAILMLESDGKLNINDPISRYFPDAPKTWAGIRLRHLLSHTAGIDDNDSLFALQTNPDAAAIRRLIWKNPLYAKPGVSFRYSNMAYVLLGHVIENVTGKPYHDFIDARIMVPLGMKSSRMISDRSIIAHRASGYAKVYGNLLNQDWVSPAFNSTADGSSYTTASDFARYLAALDNPPAWLAPYVERIAAPTPLSGNKLQPYGMGWFLARVGDTDIRFHSGSWQGFIAITVRYPKQKKSIVIFTNTDATNSIALVAAILPVALPGMPSQPPTDTLKAYSVPH